MKWSNITIGPQMLSNLFLSPLIFLPFPFVPFWILFVGNLLSGFFSYPHISSLLSFYFSFHFFHSKVKVLYGGTELFDDEVRRTFHSDMLLALFSGTCIAVLVYILTSFSCKDCFPFFCLLRGVLWWNYLLNLFKQQRSVIIKKKLNSIFSISYKNITKIVSPCLGLAVFISSIILTFAFFWVSYLICS